jgi:Flp pilus assembly protein TadB
MAERPAMLTSAWRTARLALAVLIAAAAALFILGVTIERAQPEQHADERSQRPLATEETHSAESGGEGEEAHPPSARDPTEHTAEEPRILGIDAESTPLVVLATAASLLLAAAVLRWPRSGALLAIVAIAMVAFAALDIREVAHQVDEDRNGIAILAAVIATLHLAAAALAAAQVTRYHARPSAPQI